MQICALLLSIVFVKILLLGFVVPTISAGIYESYEVGHFRDHYDEIAANLVQGNGYRIFADTSETAVRTPGYPMVLAVIFWVFGPNLFLAQIVNSLFSLGTATCVFFICRRWYVSEATAGVAALVVYFHPGFLAADSRGGVESLFALSITLLVLVIYRAAESEKAKNYFLAGLLFGWAMLVRSTVVFFPVFFLFYLWGHGIRKTSYYFGAFATGFLLLYTPWVVRNYLVFEQFVPTMTVGGTAAYEGQYLNKTGGPFVTSREALAQAASAHEKILISLGWPHRGTEFNPQFFNPRHEVRFSALLNHLVFREYRQNMGFFISSCAKNFVAFWIKSGSYFGLAINATLAAPLLVMTLLGAYNGYRRKLMVGPLCLFILCFILVHLPIMGRARYQIPILPLMVCVATAVFTKRHSSTSSTTYGRAFQKGLSKSSSPSGVTTL
jgi:hypothetical protein